MRKRSKLPVVLTVAGSDSGGGAGIQADLKTFASLRTHGVSAITCVTAQNPDEVLMVEPCTPAVVKSQLAALAKFKPTSAKTGMLYSEAIISTVAAFFESERRIPLVVDPVMVATSGARLLQPKAVEALKRKLLPRAILITPNAAEAEALTGTRIKEPEHLRTAARTLHREFGCAALVKGGHLKTSKVAVDVFFDGETELLLEAPRAIGVATHGTGCTYSAAISALLAQGASLIQAVHGAKEFITGSIHASVLAGPFTVLNPFFPR